MVKYSDTNSNRVMNDSQDVILKAEISDGNTHFVVLPGDPMVQDFQSIRILAKVSNDSVYEIRVDTDRDGITEETYSIYTPRSVHLMYDGDGWLFVSDDKIRAIEDEDHPLTALSGNKIKDQDGELIEQSGVEVVGITSINGKTPLLSGDDIVVGRINGKDPATQDSNVGFYDISATGDLFINGDATIQGRLTVNGDGGNSIIKYVIDNTVSGSFYDAIQEHYGLPGTNELIECLIKGASYYGGYFRSFTYTGIYIWNGEYRVIGSSAWHGASVGLGYTSITFGESINPNSSQISEYHFYV